jgi:Carboxypeptidase regulatory-like domain
MNLASEISKSTARLFTLFLALSFCAAAGRAQSQTPKPAGKSGGVIAGTITAHGKGVADVTVALRTAGFGGQGQDLPQAKTDAEGKYRIADVPVGSYFVTPVAPVYVVPGAGRLTFSTDPVVITGGETIDGVDFSLVRGGVVTGKVVDAEGRAVVEQTVSLQNADQQTGGRGGFFGFGAGGGSARTDDRGVYRVYGIPAGRYYVSVGAQQRLTAYSTVMGQQAYKQTFYPEATDASQATVVEVAEGEEVGHIDITVGNTVEEYSVTGQVIDKTSNMPVPNVGFTLSVLAGGGNRQRALGLMTLPVFSDAAGQFRVDNVPAGRYVVSLSPETSNGMSGESSPFDVINQDVSGVVVQAVSGAGLSGAVTLEGAQDPNVLSELLQFQVQVGVFGSGNASNAASMQTVPLNEDGSFQLSGLPAGTVRLALVAQDATLQGAFKLLRTELNGVAQPRGIPVNTGQQLSGVRLVAAYADGIVEGTVSLQNGTLAPGARIFARLAPAGQQQGGRGAGLGAATVDSRGHFVIENVPAGSYNLIVSVFNPPGGQPARRGGGQRQTPPVSAQQQVNVSEGQVSTVNVSLDLGQTQTPPPTTPPPATP